MTTPTRLGRYELLELMQVGGMGEVYRARHPELETAVAIKVLPTADLAGDVARRFAREARLAASTRHPGIVHVFDFAADRGHLYFVMEYIEGETVRDRISRGPLPVDECLRIGAELADVLAAAHAQGVVHRDVKPGNIIIDESGRVRVVDFGVSRALEDGEPLTRTGEIVGTPEYMAPEQILEPADAIDGRADIHAVGVLLYEMLTAISPFAGATVFLVLKAIESRVPPPPSRLRPGLDPAIDAIVQAALAKGPADRPQTAAALAVELRLIRGDGDVRGRSRRAARVALWIIGGCAIVLAGLAVAWPHAIVSTAPRTSTPDGAAPADTFAARIRSALGEGTDAGARHRRLRQDLAGAVAPRDGVTAYWAGRALLDLGELDEAQVELEVALGDGVGAAAPALAALWHVRRPSRRSWCASSRPGCSPAQPDRSRTCSRASPTGTPTDGP